MYTPLTISLNRELVLTIEEQQIPSIKEAARLLGMTRNTLKKRIRDSVTPFTIQSNNITLIVQGFIVEEVKYLNLEIN